MGAVLGLAATATMVALGVAFSGSGVQSVLAGSGDASAGGQYTQPAVPGMNVGATATTWTTPPAAPAIAKAAPGVHG
jgi:hypothetical protein